jgi:hypothetical protein
MNYGSKTLWVLKTRRVRWVGKLSRIGQKVMYSGIWWGKLKERDCLRGLGRDGMIILKCVCETNRTGGRALDSSGCG